jgi:hypothetical protein
MRKVVFRLSLVLGGVILGGAGGASAGWFYGTLQLRDNPDERVRTAYLAGEGVSEDEVPRVFLTLAGGVSGCVSGHSVGLCIAILLEKRRRSVTP